MFTLSSQSFTKASTIRKGELTNLRGQLCIDTMYSTGFYAFARNVWEDTTPITADTVIEARVPYSMVIENGVKGPRFGNEDILTLDHHSIENAIFSLTCKCVSGYMGRRTATADVSIGSAKLNPETNKVELEIRFMFRTLCEKH